METDLLTQDYSYCILVVILQAVHFFVLGQGIRHLREVYFSEQWLNENFGKENKDAGFVEFSSKSLGYPDMGNGKYMDKRSYKDWFTFNNAQRGHQNYLEFLAITIVSLLIAGLFKPLLAATIGFVGILGREFYVFGYSYLNNPKYRLVGALLHEFGIMINIGIGFYNLGHLLMKAGL